MKKEDVKILIIDEIPTYLQDLLLENGYQEVRQIKDFNNYEELKDYDVILCDMDNTKEPLDINRYKKIEELYPDKTVICYTSFDPLVYPHLTEGHNMQVKQVEDSDLLDLIEKALIE